jgi:hypothetical protein
MFAGSCERGNETPASTTGYLIPVYLSIGLQPFVGHWPLFSFLISYTVCRTPWTGDQPVARPLPTHTGQHKHRINSNWLPCLKWNSNPWSQCWSGRRQFMPQIARPTWSAHFLSAWAIIVFSRRTELFSWNWLIRHVSRFQKFTHVSCRFGAAICCLPGLVYRTTTDSRKQHCNYGSAQEEIIESS